MAIPSIAAARFLLRSTIPNVRWIGNHDELTDAYSILGHFGTVSTSGMITILTALAIYFMALKLGSDLSGAVFGALSYGLATPAWGWATAFFSHVSAGGCLFLGLTAIFYLLDSPQDKWRDTLLGFISGALLSWAVVIELTSAPASVVIGIYGLYNAREWKRQRLTRVFLAALVGAFIFISPLLIYNYVILGNVFESLYQYNLNFPKHREGFYGIGFPNLGVMFKLLFAQNMGLFWLSPLILSTPLALYGLWKTPGMKNITVVIIMVSLYFLLWNAAFTYWDGGLSTGPRYLIPMLPFLCLPISLFFFRSGMKVKAVLLALFLVSFLISLMSVSVSMFHANASVSLLNIKPDSGNVITSYLIPRFIEGHGFQFSLFDYSLSSFKGLLDKDLHGQIILIPLYVVYLCFGAYVFWQIQKTKCKFSDRRSNTD